MYLLNPLQNDAMHITINSTTALNIAIPPLVCRAFTRSPQKRRYPAAHASNKGHLSSAPRCNLPRDVESPMTSASLPMRFSFEHGSKRAADAFCRLIHHLRSSRRVAHYRAQRNARMSVSRFVPRGTKSYHGVRRLHVRPIALCCGHRFRHGRNRLAGHDPPSK